MSWVDPGNKQKARKPVVFTPMQGIGLDENWKSEGQVLADVFIHFIIVLTSIFPTRQICGTWEVGDCSPPPSL